MIGIRFKENIKHIFAKENIKNTYNYMPIPRC
jgi:hypothetical protein